MGAGKCRDEYAKVLRGADVVLLPDNDEVGERHCADVGQSLAGMAARTRVLRLAGLPPGGDVYDWLNAGGDAEQLAAATERANEWKVSEVRVQSAGSKEEEWSEPLSLPEGLSPGR